MYICLSATAVWRDCTLGIRECRCGTLGCKWPRYTEVCVCVDTFNFSPLTRKEGWTGSDLRSKSLTHHLHLSPPNSVAFSWIRSTQVHYSSSSCSTTMAHNRSNKTGAWGEIMMHDRVGPFISVFYNGCRVEVIKLRHHYNERAPLIETRWDSGGLCRNCISQLSDWGGGFN